VLRTQYISLKSTVISNTLNEVENKNVLALATTQSTARNLVSKVKFMYESLPSWLKIDSIENNKLSLHLNNGSKIQAKSSSSDAARSEAVSLLIIDEAAFIDNVAETWASAQQTLATGGGAIVLSTPYGTGNWFHQMWSKAESGENDFIPIRLPWDVHPERNQAWRDKQDELLGDPRLAAQECDCDFSTSGDTVFYPEILLHYSDHMVQDPLERRGADSNLWIWEPADYSKSYMVLADVARGDGKDYSAFHVIDIESNTQVAEYKGQIPTKDYGHLLVGISTEYNEALLVIENASVGWSTLQTVIERNYPNLYYTPKGDITTSYFDQYMDTSRMTAGFTMSTKSRPMVISKFAEYFHEKSVNIRSKRLLEEMRVFVWRNGKAEAQQGYNDDLVMAFGIGMYVRDTALMRRQQGVDLTKSALNNMSVNRTKYQGSYTQPNQAQNPYRIQTDFGGEDISWLL